MSRTWMSWNHGWLIIFVLVSRHAPLNSPPNENPRKKLSSLKTGRSLCDQEPSNTQECTQFVVQASGLKRSFINRRLRHLSLLLLKRRSKDTNNHHKKENQNSSELAEPCRSPTACFGLNRKKRSNHMQRELLIHTQKMEIRERKRHKRST